MIEYKVISKEFMLNNLKRFQSILSDIPNEYWEKEHFLLDLPSKWEISMAIINDSEIIGYIIASEKRTSIHIHKFMVDCNYRGKGYGSKMLHQFEEKTKSYNKKYTLKVYKNNLKAIKFYENHNYSQYDSNRDLIFMQKI